MQMCGLRRSGSVGGRRLTAEVQGVVYERREEVDAGRHREEKIEATRLGT